MFTRRFIRQNMLNTIRGYNFGVKTPFSYLSNNFKDEFKLILNGVTFRNKNIENEVEKLKSSKAKKDTEILLPSHKNQNILNLSLPYRLMCFGSAFALIGASVLPALVVIKYNLAVNLFNIGLLIGLKYDEIEADFDYKKQANISAIKESSYHIISSFCSTAMILTIPMSIPLFTILMSVSFYNSISILALIKKDIDFSDQKLSFVKQYLSTIGQVIFVTNLIIFIFCIIRWKEFKKYSRFGESYHKSKSAFSNSKETFKTYIDEIEELIPVSILNGAKKSNEASVSEVAETKN